MKLHLLWCILDYFYCLSLIFVLFGVFLEPLLCNEPSHHKDDRRKSQRRPERDGELQVVAGLHESTFDLLHSAGAQTQVVAMCSLAANDAQPSADSEVEQGTRPLGRASTPPVWYWSACFIKTRRVGTCLCSCFGLELCSGPVCEGAS